MFQNVVLDIAIGLVLMYLVLSLFCTVLNEFIATKLKLRAATLESGLKQLLDDPLVRNAFYDNGLIDGTRRSVARASETLSSSLSFTSFTTAVAKPVDAPKAAETEQPRRDGLRDAAPPKDASASQAQEVEPVKDAREHPPYLSADAFAKALIASLDPTKPIPAFSEVQDAVKALPDSNMKDALLAALTAAGDDLNRFRSEVATWFDDSMERLSGAYKRHLKWISLTMGILVAIIVNADSFDVGYALWSDSPLRAQMVEAARATTAQVIKDKPAATPSDVGQAFEDANTTLRPLPIGWPLRTWPGKVDPAKPAKAAAAPVDWVWFVITKLLGWIATGFALSLGAPFWFDVLGKLVNIRGSGEKPKRADAK